MSISIRSLLLLVFVLMLPLAGFMNRYNGKRKVASYVTSVNGTVRWSHQFDGWDDANAPPGIESPIGKWIRKILGDKVFSHIRRIAFSVDSSQLPIVNRLLDAEGDTLRGLTRLKISVTESGSTQLDIHALKKLPDVRLLDISGATIGRREFESLAEMEDLEILWIGDCEFDATDICGLADSPHLAWIEVGGDRASSEALNGMRDRLPSIYISF